MREILFRGKCTDNSKWVEGSLFIADKLPFQKTAPVQICTGDNIEWTTYDVIPESVGQYTGCLDKEGTKVFEGDIVWDNENEQLGVVGFDEGEFYVSFDGNIESGFADVINCCYIQGNIHDDAKMLSLW